MAPLSGDTAIFYVVLIAPGFVAVMTAISLAAVEQDHSQFVLLVWSLVTSLIIDTVFLFLYQTHVEEISSFSQFSGILFSPNFRVDIIAGILLGSVVLGVVAAAGLLVDVPGRSRRLLQRWSTVSYNPRQPWENFMRTAKSVRIKTTDDEAYVGDVLEWSRAEKPREVRIGDPHRFDIMEDDYVPVGGEAMLFLDKDIDRILLRSEDPRESRVRRLYNAGVSWMRRRRVTGGIVLFLAGWYGVQLWIAGEIGVEDAEKWFYFTDEPWTGWVFAPISHDMERIGHLRRNVTNLILAGSFIEPHLETREYLKLFFGLSVFSILIPAVGSAMLVAGDWLVAGASGGIYGIWVFAAVYRFDVVRTWREWFDMDDWSDMRCLFECLMVLFGLALLVVVPVLDVTSGNGSNAVSHVAGMVFGAILGSSWRKGRLGLLDSVNNF